MAKRSGWNNYKKRYPHSWRGRDTGAPGRTRESLGSFAENSRGPVARSLWEENTVYYADNGSVAVNEFETKAAAVRLYKETKDASYARDHLVKSYRDTQPDKDRLTPKAAERRLNKEQANRARGILAAADVGKVKLTRAQRFRLNEVSQGKYTDVIYTQYKSADRGTLIGVKPKAEKLRSRNDPNTAERRREFYENVYSQRHGLGSKRKTA